MSMRAFVAMATVCLAVGTISFADNARAQTASQQAGPGTEAGSDPSKIEEVVVTSTHQGELALSKIPMSINAETQGTLDSLGIKTSQDLTRIVPGLRIESNGAAGTVISIRGIRSTNGAATTGIYLGDAALQARSLGGTVNGGGAFLPGLFDLQRVEVLKGPQGTLYGGSSEGGTVRYIMNEPSLTTYSGNVKSEVNSVDQGGTGWEVGGAFGGPIVQDTLGFRVSAWSRHIAGYVDHVDWRDPAVPVAKDTNYEDSHAYRAAFTLAPVDGLKLSPVFYYANDELGDSNTINRSIAPYTTPAFGTVGSTPIYGSYSGAGLTAAQVKALDPSGAHNYLIGQNITGGLLPAGYVPPTTSGFVTNVPGYEGKQVFIHAANTYGPIDLGNYNSVSTTNAGFGYTGPVVPQNNPRHSTIFLPSLTGSLQAGPVEILSVTSYLNDTGNGLFASSVQTANNATATTGYAPNVQSGFVFDAPNPLLSYFNYNANRNALSQELRARSLPSDSPFSFVAGVYYNNANTNSLAVNYASRTSVYLPLFGHPQIYNAVHTPAEIAGNIQQSVQIYLNENELAGFGEFNYAITSKLKATAGVRISRERVTFESQTYGLLYTVTPANPTLVDGVEREKPVTPKFTASYQLTPDDMVYATAAKGFRAGGVQSQASPVCAADLAALNISQTPATYGSDSVWSYELGAKMKALDQKIQVSGSVYEIDWSNPQTPYTLPTCAFSYITNIGHAVSRGFDLDSSYLVLPGLTLNLSLGLTDAHYTEQVRTQPNATTGATLLLVPKGQPFIGVPDWNGTLGARYDLRLSGEWRAYVLGQYQYSGRFYNTFGPGVTSYSPDVYTTPARSYVTARLGFMVKELDVSVFADNIFNNDTLVPSNLGGRVSCRNAACSIYGSYYQGISGETYRPRTVGLTVNYAF
jgi:iron complex outermembrane recepter protein